MERNSSLFPFSWLILSKGAKNGILAKFINQIAMAISRFEILFPVWLIDWLVYIVWFPIFSLNQLRHTYIHPNNRNSIKLYSENGRITWHVDIFFLTSMQGFVCCFLFLGLSKILARWLSMFMFDKADNIVIALTQLLFLS